MGQVGDVLIEVLLEPQGGVDVPGGRGGVGHAPVGTAHVLPGEGLAGVDLGGQLLALRGGAGDHQSPVAGDLLGGGLGGGVVVPILGVVGVDRKAVPGGGKQHVAAVVVEHVGAAGNQAHIGGAGRQGLAHRLIAGAHGDVHLTHVIAQLGQLISEHLLQGLGGGDDLVRLPGGDEGDTQGVDGLVPGLLGVTGVRRAAGTLRVLRVLTAAAGQQANAHHAGQQERKCFLHTVILLNVSFLWSVVDFELICYRGEPL